MTLHKEGTPSIILVSIFSILLIALSYYFFPQSQLIKVLAVGISLALTAIILQFFRKPNRTLIANDSFVYAPADGKVVVIEETLEDEFLHEKRIQVSIFMSPFNVHINWYPISGIVKYFKYHPGKFLVAWHPKASTDNERTTVVVEQESGFNVLFRQIAGAMARRIVCYAKEQDTAEQGNEMGFIKFGSRVDVFLPVGTKVLVNLEDKVIGNRTPIAEIPTALKAN